MKDKVEIEVWVCTNKVGSESRRKITIDREEWEDFSGEEKEEYMLEEMLNLIEWNWEEKP